MKNFTTTMICLIMLFSSAVTLSMEFQGDSVNGGDHDVHHHPSYPEFSVMPCHQQLSVIKKLNKQDLQTLNQRVSLLGNLIEQTKGTELANQLLPFCDTIKTNQITSQEIIDRIQLLANSPGATSADMHELYIRVQASILTNQQILINLREYANTIVGHNTRECSSQHGSIQKHA